MTLHITPAMMEASYELLRTTPPFRGWKLPAADEVEFKVISSESRSADYFRKADGTHCIRANQKWIGSLNGLVATMAHEMCHMHHNIECPSNQAWHGKWFQSAARQVCRYHHFDPKSF